MRQYDSPDSPSRDPRTSNEMHEINSETKNTLFTYLQLSRLQVIIENLEFSHSPSGIVRTPVNRTQAPEIERESLRGEIKNGMMAYLGVFEDPGRIFTDFFTGAEGRVTVP
jgi:hypothetical protein